MTTTLPAPAAPTCTVPALGSPSAADLGAPHADAAGSDLRGAEFRRELDRASSAHDDADAPAESADHPDDASSTATAPTECAQGGAEPGDREPADTPAEAAALLVEPGLAAPMQPAPVTAPTATVALATAGADPTVTAGAETTAVVSPTTGDDTTTAAPAAPEATTTQGAVGTGASITATSSSPALTTTDDTTTTASTPGRVDAAGPPAPAGPATAPSEGPGDGALDATTEPVGAADADDVAPRAETQLDAGGPGLRVPTGPAATTAPVAPPPPSAVASPADPTAEPLPTVADQLLRTEELAESLRATFRRGDRTTSLSIQLHPAELGAVRIEAKLVDGVTHLVMRAESGAGFERLSSALDQLRTDLSDHGVDLGGLELQHGRADDGHPGTDETAASAEPSDTTGRRSGTVAPDPSTPPTHAAAHRGAVAIDL